MEQHGLAEGDFDLCVLQFGAQVEDIEWVLVHSRGSQYKRVRIGQAYFGSRDAVMFRWPAAELQEVQSRLEHNLLCCDAGSPVI